MTHELIWLGPLQAPLCAEEPMSGRLKKESVHFLKKGGSLLLGWCKTPVLFSSFFWDGAKSLFTFPFWE